MPATIRLSKELEEKLRRIAIAERKSKSKLIKEALVHFFETRDNNNSPYELGKEYFGKYGSGRTDLSINRKKLLRDKIRAKSSR